jgi:hypothetical protein
MNTILQILPDQIRCLGVEVINFNDFFDLVIRFTINLIVNLLLVRWLYYSNAKRKDYLFTYLLIGTIVFLLCYLLANVKLQLGFALGLFAVFGILRYRTSQVPIKEMTYLFLVISVSVINALADKEVAIAHLVFSDSVIILITYGLEKLWLLKHESAKTIIYEKIDLIKPENYSQLIDDLQQRTGINKINRVEIGSINFLRDTCTLIIYYYETGPYINRANDQDKISKNDDDS